MTKFSEEIVEKIKHEHIAPLPRWRFFLRRSVVWAFFIVSIILGSVSFGVAVEMMINGDWEVNNYLHLNKIAFLFIMVPYFWIFFLALFLALVLYNWKHTRHGYRVGVLYVFISSIGVSVLLGILLYSTGFGRKVDSLMARNFSLYRDNKKANRDSLWLNPENGLLTGEVEHIDNNGTIIVKDSRGIEWNVVENPETITKTQIIIENQTVGRGKKKIIKKKGDEITVIGEKDSEKGKIFVAKEIKIIDNDGDDELDAMQIRDIDEDKIDEELEKE